MIISMLFICPENHGQALNLSLERQQFHVLKFWSEQLCHSSVTLCCEVPAYDYDEMKKIGLNESSTQNILNGIQSCIGTVKLQNFMVTSSEIAKHNGIRNFTIRVTELGHPNGFDYLAIGLTSQ